MQVRIIAVVDENGVPVTREAEHIVWGSSQQQLYEIQQPDYPVRGRRGTLTELSYDCGTRGDSVFIDQSMTVLLTSGVYQQSAAMQQLDHLHRELAGVYAVHMLAEQEYQGGGDTLLATIERAKAEGVGSALMLVEAAMQQLKGRE